MKKRIFAALVAIIVLLLSSCSDNKSQITVGSHLEQLGYTEAATTQTDRAIGIPEIDSEVQDSGINELPETELEDDNTNIVSSIPEVPVTEIEESVPETTVTDEISSDDISDSEATEITYVLNISSKKIHLPTCSSVNDIKTKNRHDTNMTLDELLEQGYSSCGRCKPETK